MWSEFVEWEWGRLSPKEREKSIQTKSMLELMQSHKQELIVRMAFAADHLQEFAAVINTLQSRMKLVAATAALKWAQLARSMKQFSDAPQWSPRVLEALKGMPASELQALKEAVCLIVKEMDVQTVKHATTLKAFQRLEVLDPKLLTMVNTDWLHIKELFHLPDEMQDEWEQYVRMDPTKVCLQFEGICQVLNC